MTMRHAIRTAVFSLAFAGFASAANAQAMQFFAVLDGGHEVSNAGDAAAGDLNGNGVASILLGASGQLCFSLLVRGIATPTVAHIHSGLPGVNGPISIALTPVPTNGTLGSSSGCLTGLSATTTNQIKASPGKFYVNVHNGAFPGGAIRGQLSSFITAILQVTSPAKQARTNREQCPVGRCGRGAKIAPRRRAAATVRAAIGRA